MFSNLRQIPVTCIKTKNSQPQQKVGAGTTHNIVNLVILTAHNSFSLQQCTAVYASACSLLCSQPALSDSKLQGRIMGSHRLLTLSRAWRNITGTSVPLHLPAHWNLCCGWMEAWSRELTLALCWPSISSKPEKVPVVAYLLCCFCVSEFPVGIPRC